MIQRRTTILIVIGKTKTVCILKLKCAFVLCRVLKILSLTYAITGEEGFIVH
jgi:hypothetical protein